MCFIFERVVKYSAGGNIQLSKPTQATRKNKQGIFKAEAIMSFSEQPVFIQVIKKNVGRYGLGHPGIESRWRRDFTYQSKPASRSTCSAIQWVTDPFPKGTAARAWH